MSLTRFVANTIKTAHPLADLDTLVHHCEALLPLFNALRDVVFFIKDNQARYVMVNQALALRCGYRNANALLGKTTAELFPLSLGTAYLEQDRQILQQGQLLMNQLETHFLPGRSPGWCLTCKLPLRDAEQQIVGLAGFSQDLPAGDGSHPAFAKVALVKNHIQKHFAETITLDDLTGLVSLSASQLERHCKRILQLTPRQLIHKARIDHALDLLANSPELPITDIALGCGYSDHSAFSRKFKAVTGLTPSQYRQAARDGEA